MGICLGKRRPAGQKCIAILFDFDGTIGNTETPAMEVAFWEIAPYLVKADGGALEEMKVPWMQNNAGKAFEFMLEALEKERASAGLEPIETVRKNGGEDSSIISVVDNARNRFNLPPLQEVKYETLLVQQKEETVTALGVMATPCSGIEACLELLNENKVPFCISTTSGKPRVPVCVKCMNFERYFPPHKIHSGESDFTPSRFKPAPDVYLKAAKSEGYKPEDCVAVEDSVSGVGSAANALLGFIIGYVGASHIPAERKESHAKDLLSGRKSKDGRGANIVIHDMQDAFPLMMYFLKEREAGRKIANSKIPKPALEQLKGKYYVSETV
eukprot:CAMPEP_0197541402 /NCGR_PEP_ID=MMETSP1318-20131121/67138_1 /TAXON_ID=552666 /ORGANISM="Partenskyella glossopodia, Strain RCC365" /LENGTH=327 /DNA_ID=CAMNT_0043100569 /DNA_START=920 /DNA_END=1903 /DNA_ORIENTATION=-